MRSTRFSPRRRLLLVAVLAMIALMLVLRALGVAGFNGAQLRDMDWNADGEVTRREMLQGFHAVSVKETTEGQRVCRHYAWLRDAQTPIRVDCRVEFAPGAPAP